MYMLPGTRYDTRTSQRVRMHSYIHTYCSEEQQTSERTDDVSPYLMVNCAKVPVRKFPERLPTGCHYLI